MRMIALILSLVSGTAWADSSLVMPTDTRFAGGDAPLPDAARDNFMIAVSGCWRIDSETPAGQIAVTVAFSLDPQGRVIGDVTLVAPPRGNDPAVEAAFQMARRAILRCQGDGYGLPVESYDNWRNIEMTFDPAVMVLR